MCMCVGREAMPPTCFAHLTTETAGVLWVGGPVGGQASETALQSQLDSARSQLREAEHGACEPWRPGRRAAVSMRAA